MSERAAQMVRRHSKIGAAICRRSGCILRFVTMGPRPGLFFAVCADADRKGGGRASSRGSCAPKGRKPIEWKLITDLLVRGRAEAIEKINWYAMRWKIEVFHKILKSGCRAEDSKLRTAERLADLMAVFCILSWRVLWVTMLNRIAPDASPTMALTDSETALLDQLVGDSGNRRCKSGTLSFYLTKLARLGGYLARTGDPPPGNVVIWRGLSRLTDIEIGAELRVLAFVGN